MTQLANMVRQVSQSSGNGNLTLLSNTNGFNTFASAFGTGSTTNVFFYSISNSIATEWEFGTGHMSNSTTFVRDTVLNSSNSNSLVSFTSGGFLIIVCSPPQSLLSLLETTTGSGALVLANNPSLSGPYLGTPLSGNLSNCSNYPIRTMLSPQSTTSGTSFSYSLPSGVKEFKVMLKQVVASASSIQVQLVTSSGTITSGYLCAAGFSTAVVTSSTGFIINGFATTASYSFSGSVTFSMENSSNNTWVSQGAVYAAVSDVDNSSGYVTLSNPVTGLIFSTVTAAATFSAGEINVSYTL